VTSIKEATRDVETPLLQSLHNFRNCLDLLLTRKWILFIFIECRYELCWLEYASYIMSCSC